MRIIICFICVFLPICAVAASGADFRRQQIRAVGSSTVYPFATVVAEQFGQGGKFKTPIIEATGTGGGFKLFCEGLGEKTPDISNASRPITDSEKSLCHKNGVDDILEIPIGYDGIVFASKRGTPLLNLSKKDLFLALAREIPDANGKLISNPYKKWKEINPKLPDSKIEVYGPPPTSGTRDAFVELVMEKGCEQVKGYDVAYPDARVRKKYCAMLREDGGFVEAGEDDNVVMQKLSFNSGAIGILGYSFVEENADKVQANKIEGELPDYSSIESGAYSVSRSIYVYVKMQHLGKVAGIYEFVRELVSENAIGKDGYATERGLLPLSDAERHKTREMVKTKFVNYGK